VSVVTQSQLALAQQWYALRRALREEWPWHIGDWACLAKEHPEETDIYLVEYVWEGLLEVRPTGTAPSAPPLRQPADWFFPLPSRGFSSRSKLIWMSCSQRRASPTLSACTLSCYRSVNARPAR
jgi:hypothetical protein